MRDRFTFDGYVITWQEPGDELAVRTPPLLLRSLVERADLSQLKSFGITFWMFCLGTRVMPWAHSAFGCRSYSRRDQRYDSTATPRHQAIVMIKLSPIFVPVSSPRSVSFTGVNGW
jgi:hypothetical protein